MKIGELNKRISFVSIQPVINENGFETQEETVVKTVWAKASNLYGKEFYEAAAVQKEQSVKFIIRAMGDIDESMKIRFDGKLYDIAFIDDIKYAGKTMEIKALEVEPSG